jgi:hypothetical protein
VKYSLRLKKHPLAPTKYTILWRGPNTRYDGMPYHATERTIWWRGTGTTPPALEVMVASNATPPLHIEQWREIGGVADPRY